MEALFAAHAAKKKDDADDKESAGVKDGAKKGAPKKPEVVTQVDPKTDISPHLPTSPHISPHLPTSPHISPLALGRPQVATSQLNHAEAHGTGTALGDPIETSSLAVSVLRGRSASDPILMLGSGKANVGHAETGAGMTGLVKLMLELRHAQLVANAQLRVANPHVATNLGGLRAMTPTQHSVTSSLAAGATGGVSSYGYSGTIVHAVLSHTGELTPPEVVSTVRYRRVAYWWGAKRAPKSSPSTEPAVVSETVRALTAAMPRGDGSLINLRLDPSTKVAVVELNDAQRFNTIGSALGDDLEQAVAWLTKQSADTVKAVSLQAVGPHFCPGGNPYATKNRPESLDAFAYSLATPFNGAVQLRAFPAVITAAVQGTLIGGGVAFATQVDYVVASADATFEHGNLTRGVCPLGQFSQTFAHVLGSTVSTNAYMTNALISAPSAVSIGLAHELCSGAVEAQARSRQAAHLLSSQPALAELIIRTRLAIDADAIMREAYGHAACLSAGSDEKPPTSTFASSVDTLELRAYSPAAPTTAEATASADAFTIKTAHEMAALATEESVAEQARLAEHISTLKIPPAIQRQLAGGEPAPSPSALAPGKLRLDHAKGVAMLTVGKCATERELVALLGTVAAHLSAMGSTLRCVLFSDLRRPAIGRCSARTNAEMHAALEQLLALHVPLACTAFEFEPADITAPSAIIKLFQAMHHQIVISPSMLRGGHATELVRSRAGGMSRLRTFGSWAEQQPPIGLTKMLDLVNFHRTGRASRRNAAAHTNAVATAKARLASTAGTRAEIMVLLQKDLIEPEAVRAPLRLLANAARAHALRSVRVMRPVRMIGRAKLAPAHDVGIHAIQIYVPRHSVDATQLDLATGAPGRSARSQLVEQLTCCGQDEDTISMALTATKRLISAQAVVTDAVGGVYVGSSSLLDRSKSLKSEVMALFEASQRADAEGTDFYHGESSGMAALQACLSFVNGGSWDGRLAVCVCSEVAQGALARGLPVGSAAVAMLIGPSAPLRVEPEYVCQMKHQVCTLPASACFHDLLSPCQLAISRSHQAWDFISPIATNRLAVLVDSAEAIGYHQQALIEAEAELLARVGAAASTAAADRVVVSALSGTPSASLRSMLAVLGKSSNNDAILDRRAAASQKLASRIGGTGSVSAFIGLASALMSEAADPSNARIAMVSQGAGMTLAMRLTKLGATYVSGFAEDRILHTPRAFAMLQASHLHSFATHTPWHAYADPARRGHAVYRTGSYAGGSGIGERGYVVMDAPPVIYAQPRAVAVGEAASSATTAPSIDMSAALAMLMHAAPAQPAAVAAPACTIDVAAMLREAANDMIGSVTADAPLMEAGLDSLASVEFRNRLQQQLGDTMTLPDTLVFDFPTLRQLEKHIAAEVAASAPATTAPAVPGAPATAAGNANLMAMLAQMLQGGTSVVAPPAAQVCTIKAAEVLKSVADDMIGSVTADAPLMEAGLDSLASVEFRNRLQQQLGDLMQISETFVFDFPTLRQMEKHIVAEIAAGAPVLAAPAMPAISIGAPPALSTAIARPTVYVNGLSCILPGGANSLDLLWNEASASIDAVGEVPYTRWDVTSDHDASVSKRVVYGAFVSGADLFDNRAFGVSAAEGTAMDPQHRLVLEDGYRALAAAGVDRMSLIDNANVGVAIGIYATEYMSLQAGWPQGRSVYAATNSLSIAAGRVSYTLGMQGPCLTVETACSASLVACHVAMRSVQLNECASHLANGANLMLSPACSTYLAIAGMTSMWGRCLTYDDRANGFGRGEGMASVALAAGDEGKGVLRGGAVRQDGRSASLTAPNGQAQQSLFRAAQEDTSIRAGDTMCVEAHGTGTALGDPIETGSVSASLVSATGVTPTLTGLKATIAHTESTAGLAGMVKLALQLRRREAAPNVQLRNLNPKVFSAMGTKLQLAAFPVQTAQITMTDKCTGGVSSFGYAGSLAHSVLEYTAPTAGVAHTVVRYRRRAFPVRPDCPPPPVPKYKALYGMAWFALSKVYDVHAHSRSYTILTHWPAHGSSALAIEAALKETEPSRTIPNRTDAIIIALDAAAASRPSVDGMRLALLNALKLVSSMKTRLLFLTRGAHGPMHSTGALGRSAASNGGVWGLGRVARVEMPSAHVDSVDIVMPVGGGMRAVVGVIDSAQASTELASRGRTLYEVRLRRGATVDDATVKPRVVGGSDVVITGGLGGLGLHITPWLLSHRATSVVLTSRSGQVTRDGQGLDVQLKTLLSRSKRDVLVRVSDAGIIEDLVALLHEQPHLSAFMHAPHVIRDRTIYAMTPASVHADVPAVFSAKAMGASNVTNAFATRRAHFGVLFSSTASLGAMGVACHSAGNVYLDSLALNARGGGFAMSRCVISPDLPLDPHPFP